MTDTRDIDWQKAYIESVARHNETLDELRVADAEVWRLREAVHAAHDALFAIRDGATGLYGDDLRHCNTALAQLVETLDVSEG